MGTFDILYVVVYFRPVSIFSSMQILQMLQLFMFFLAGLLLEVYYFVVAYREKVQHIMM